MRIPSNAISVLALSSFTLILGVINLNNSASAQSANSVHPFFRSSITEIRSKLPREMYVKVPKGEFSNIKFPLSLNQMTPLINYEEEVFSIVLCGTTSINRNDKIPYCNRVGFIGSIEVFRSSNKEILSRHTRNKTGVWRSQKFTNGVTARCWSSGQQRTNLFPYCMWQENDQVFVVTAWDSLVDAVINGVKVQR